MNRTSDIISLPDGAHTPDKGRVVFCDGLFYAQLAVNGLEKPLTIALHGVTTELEAAQALGAILPGTPRSSSHLFDTPQFGN